MKRLLALVLVATLALAARPAAAADEVQVNVSAADNKWPSAIIFNVEATSDSDVKSITLNYSWGRGKVSNVARPDRFDPAKNVKTQIQIKTAGRDYVPPFSEMKYTVTAEDGAGKQTTTPVQSFIYQDTRYRWSSLQDGLLTVYYHGDNKSAAQQSLDAGVQAIADVSKSFGVQVTEPLKAIVYNTKPEIDGALPFESATTQRDLVIEGQAHSDYNLVLLLDDQSLLVSTRHELTHVVTNQAAGNSFTEIPFWLNEGLSVFNQGNGGAEYATYLQRAVRTNTLIPIRNLTAKPGKPDDILLGYGEGYSVVKYLVEKYGPEKMAAFLAAYKEGNTDDGAMKKAYGFDRDQLEKEWRASLGAQPAPARATPPPAAASQPQPTAVPSGPPRGSAEPGEGGSALGGLFLLIVGLGGVLGCVVIFGLAGFLITLALRRR
jgi:hypothetical protein